MSTSTDRPSTSPSNSVFILYRFFAADDTLLYIGLTRNPAKRLEQHAGDKSWWTEVARVEFQHFTDLAELRDAERRAITTEKPTHNIRMNGSTPKSPKTRTVDPLEEIAVDGLVGRYFHSFEPEGTEKTHSTIINGRLLKWQGRVLEEINSELYTIETYSFWDGCATGHRLVRIDDMLDWRYYDTALGMQVALPCGEHHDNGEYCRGEREYYSDIRAGGFIHFICHGRRKRYPGFANYTPLAWRDGKPHLK